MSLPPENDALTDWERIERDGLRAAETAEWRAKRAIAENLDTSAVVLAQLTDEVITAWLDDPRGTKKQGHFVVEAVAAHSNTPPDTLLKLLTLEKYYYDTRRARDIAAGWMQPNYGSETEWSIGETLAWATALCVKGACRNPVVPYLCLESPDFWAQVGVGQGYLLRDRTLLYAIAAQLSQQNEPMEPASNHVVLSGELGVECNEQDALNQLQNALGPKWSPEIFSLIPSARTSGLDLDFEAQSFFWKERVKAALLLPLTNQPLSLDTWQRSPLQLMHHLAHDGNRFVRWVTQTRLADPDFAFTWADEEQNAA